MKKKHRRVKTVKLSINCRARSMIKLDKLCKISPDMYSLITDTGRGKIYCLEDKTLISFRAKKRELSEEQRLAAGERMRKYHKSRN